MLRIEDLWVSYGHVRALSGVSLEVKRGAIVSIIGSNGAGKSTLLNTVSGLVRPEKGKIFIWDETGPDTASLLPKEPHRVVRLGVVQVPEGRQIFPGLTVKENLLAGAYTVADRSRVAANLCRMFNMFPILEERSSQQAGTLSGGEQQMLAICRGLMSDPKLLLLDEPSLGLAPLLVRSIFETVRAINETGVTVILVEQNARAALRLARRGYVMEVGNIVMEDLAQNLLANPEVQNAYLGGAAGK